MESALYSSGEKSSYLPVVSLRGGLPQTDRICDRRLHRCSRSDICRRPEEPYSSHPGPGPSPESVRREEEGDEEDQFPYF